MDKSGISSAINESVQEEIADVVAFIRKEAEKARGVANDYRIKDATADVRVWQKVAEHLGRIANRIERGEYR